MKKSFSEDLPLEGEGAVGSRVAFQLNLIFFERIVSKDACLSTAINKDLHMPRYIQAAKMLFFSVRRIVCIQWHPPK